MLPFRTAMDPYVFLQQLPLVLGVRPEILSSVLVPVRLHRTEPLLLMTLGSLLVVVRSDSPLLQLLDGVLSYPMAILGRLPLQVPTSVLKHGAHPLPPRP